MERENCKTTVEKLADLLWADPNSAPGLFFTETPIMSYNILRSALPEFALEEVTDGYKLTIYDPDGGMPEGSSIAAGDILIPRKQARVFKHDFTFGLSHSDVQLGTVFGDSAHSHMSPDYIKTNGNRAVVMEFATRARSGAGGKTVVAAYKTKIDKYLTALKFHSSAWSISYAACVVSPSDVAFSHNLPEDLVQDLCYRYSFAQAVQAQLLLLGVMPAEEEQDDREADELLSYLRSIPVKLSSKNPRFLTHDKYFYTTRGNPDLGKIMTTYTESCAAGLNSREVPRTSLPARIEEKYKSGVRTDYKCVTRVPLCKPDVTPQDSSLKSLHSVELGAITTPVARIWNSALVKVKTGQIQEDHEDLNEFINHAKSGGVESGKPHRNLYMRAKLDIDPADAMELASVGVQGKRHKHDPIVLFAKADAKKPFSYNAPTDDIEDFLDFEWDAEMPVTTEMDNLKKLLKEAVALAGDNLQQFTSDNEMINHPLYRVLSVISDIGLELAISFKQHVEKDVFILKKLALYDMYMLIKPTRGSSHIFVSFMMPIRGDNEVLYNRPFRPMEDYGTFWASDFVSHDSGRLHNLVTAPFILNSFREYVEDAYPDSQHMWKTINLAVLAHLEDKASTTDVLTLVRYISMKCFTVAGVNAEMDKLVDKLPVEIRSRLTLWAVKKCSAFMTNPPIQPMNLDADPDESFSGNPVQKWTLQHPFFGTPLRGPQELIDIYYLGYFRDKNGVTQRNQEPALVIKIVEKEDELSKANNDNFGTNSFEPLSSGHEFSMDHVLAAADATKTYFRKTMGQNWEDLITKDILESMRHTSFEELATLKASSRFEPGELPKPNEKVLVAVLEILEDLEGKFITSIPSLVKLIDQAEELKITIFKKNQKTGLREIYILDIQSRLCQHIIESIARCICRRLQMETMENPRNKEHLQLQHSYKTSRTFEASFNLCSSYDAKTWNQYHHVTKFQIYLCRLLPRAFHGIITTILHAWYKKKIQLPEGLLNLMQKGPDLKVTDPTLQKILDAHHGKIKVPWMTPGSNFVTTESGMLQGILHYVSSAFHASTLLLRDSLFKLLVQKSPYASKVITMDQVSSDDSGRITTCEASESGLKSLIVADHMSYKHFMPFFGVHQSPKSAVACQDVYEFNSTWLWGRTIINPIIKFVISAQTVTEEETLYGRQEVFYSCLQNCLENGATFRVTHAVQVHQLAFNYKVLGSSVSRGFSEYTKMLVNVPDPGLGFFLLDSRYHAGLFGLRYSLWVAANASPLISGRLAVMLSTGDYSSSSAGAFINLVMIRWGNLEKYFKIKERAEQFVPFDWRSEGNAMPSVLYTYPKDKDQTRIKIMAKLSCSSVAKSLAGMPSIVRVLASSVYIITHRACTNTREWDKRSARKGKESLLSCLAGYQPYNQVLTDEQKKFLFPYTDSYAEVYRLVQNVRQCTEVPCLYPRKKNRAIISIFRTAALPPVSLEAACKTRWFNFPSPCSGTQMAETWARYKEIFPWLKETEAETADFLQFDSFQLRNLIARTEDKERKIKLITVPVKGGFSHSVVSLMLRNHSTLTELKATDPGVHLEAPKDAPGTLHKLAMLCLYPFSTHAELEKLVTQEIQSAKDPWTDIRDRATKGCVQLSLIKKWMDAKDNPSEFKFQKLIDFIHRARDGVVGAFTKRQVRQDGKYSGPGIWQGTIGSSEVSIHLQDSEIIKVICRDSSKLFESRQAFEDFIKSEDWAVKSSYLRNAEGNLFLSKEGLICRDALRGLPIEVQESLRPAVTSATLKNARLEVTPAGPGVLPAVRVKKDTYCCITLILSPSYILPGPYTHRQAAISSWFKLEELPTKTAFNWLRSHAHERTRRQLKEKVAELINGSLARAGFSNLATTQPLPYPDDYEVSLDIPDEIMNMNVNFAELTTKTPDFEDLYSFTEFEAKDPDAPNMWDFLKNIRWLDSVFNYYRTNLSKNDRESILTLNKVSIQGKALAEILNFYLDKKIAVEDAQPIVP